MTALRACPWYWPVTGRLDRGRTSPTGSISSTPRRKRCEGHFSCIHGSRCRVSRSSPASARRRAAGRSGRRFLRPDRTGHACPLRRRGRGLADPDAAGCLRRRDVPFDRSARLEVGREVSESEYLSLVSKQTLDWSAAERELLRTILEDFRVQTARWKLDLPPEVLLLKTTGREEGSAAYCRGPPSSSRRAMSPAAGARAAADRLPRALPRLQLAPSGHAARAVRGRRLRGVPGDPASAGAGEGEADEPRRAAHGRVHPPARRRRARGGGADPARDGRSSTTSGQGRSLLPPDGLPLPGPRGRGRLAAAGLLPRREPRLLVPPTSPTTRRTSAATRTT